MKLKVAIEEFTLHLRACDMSPHTVASYGHDLELLADFTDKPIERVTSSLLDGFVTSPAVTRKADGSLKKAGSVDKVKTSLKAFFRWATEAGHVPHNPAAILRIKQRRRVAPEILTVTHYPEAASNRFCARVVTGAAAAGQRRFTIRLCEKHMSSNGPELEVWSRTLLLDPRQVTVEGARAVIPMEFDLSDVPEPPEDTPSAKTVWSAVVRATGQRPEYLASFMLSPTGSPFVRFGDGHLGAGRRP